MIEQAPTTMHLSGKMSDYNASAAAANFKGITSDVCTKRLGMEVMQWNALNGLKQFARKQPILHNAAASSKMMRDTLEMLINVSSNAAHLEFIEFSYSEDGDLSFIKEKGVQLQYFCTELPRCLHKTKVQPLEEFKKVVDMELLMGKVEYWHHDDWDTDHHVPSHGKTLSLMKWAPLPEISENLTLVKNLKHTWKKSDLLVWLKLHHARQIKWLQEQNWDQ